jgi:hypothetical protein
MNEWQGEAWQTLEEEIMLMPGPVLKTSFAVPYTVSNHQK